jgi:hypothetical protein
MTESVQVWADVLNFALTFLTVEFPHDDNNNVLDNLISFLER